MASDHDRAALAFEMLNEQHTRAEGIELIKMCDEPAVRDAARITGRKVPAWLEAHWAAPRIALELMKSGRVTVFTATGTSPLAWTVTSKPRRSEQS